MVLEVFFNKSISNYYEIDDTITLVLTEDIDNLRFIKSKMEQINEILIASCDERNINQIKQLFNYNKKLIVNSDCVSHQMLLKLKEMFGNNFYVKSKYNEHEDVLVDEYLKTIDKLFKMKEYIEHYSLSPLERLIYIYDMVKERIYKTSSVSNSCSRDLTKVLNEEEIVCEGYSNIMTSLANFLGLNTFVKIYHNLEKTDGHATVGVYLNDLKYDIHGVFECDPTWDRKRSIEDNDFINNYSWCMEKVTKSERIKEKNLITEPDLIRKQITKAYNDIFNEDYKDYDILIKQAFKIFYKKASNFYKEIGLNLKENEVLGLMGTYEVDKVNEIYKDILSYYNIQIDPEDFIKALYNARRIEYLSNPDVRRLTFDDLEKSIVNKYNLNMMSRINFLLEYGTVEGIIFGEDDIDVNDDEFSKIEEDNLKLRLLYDLKTYLGIKKDNIRRR